MQYVVIGSRCLLGLVFAVAAFSKLRSRGAFGEFAESVGELRVLNDRWVRTVAAAVAISEALTVALMAAPRPLAIAGFVLGSALLTFFAAVIVSRRRHGIRTRCRCFGAGTATLGGLHVVRNAALAAAASVGAVGLVAGPQPAAHPGGLAVAAAAGAALALLAIKLDDLITLFGPEPSTPLEPKEPRS